MTMKYVSSSDSYHFWLWSFKFNYRSREWAHILLLQPGTTRNEAVFSAGASCRAKTWHNFSPALCPCKTCPRRPKGAWLARDQRRTHPDSSVFFPFCFLHDSWNVFAHGGKNAKSREKWPGMSPSLSPFLLALSCRPAGMLDHASVSTHGRQRSPWCRWNIQKWNELLG